MAPQKLDVSVDKPTPYTFDLGLLLAHDPNPLPMPDAGATPDRREERLAQAAREGAQALINQLLTTLPLSSTQAGVLLSLPSPATPLPREKPLPPAREQTKWERFAAKKGIKPKTREQRRAKASQFNETTGEWERTWGYKGPKPKDGRVPEDWLTEVSEKGEAAADASGSKNKKRKKA